MGFCVIFHASQQDELPPHQRNKDKLCSSQEMVLDG